MPTSTLSEQALINRVLTADRKLTRAAVNAVVAARDAPGTLRQVSALITQGRIEEAVEAAARAGAIQVNNASAAVYVQSGQQTAAALSEILNVTVEFDQVHDFAVSHIRTNRLNLVREWLSAQRGAANQALTEGVRAGMNPIAQARVFRASTGLTQFQEASVQNYRTLLTRVSQGDTEALTRSLRDHRFDPSIRRAARTGKPLTRAQIDTMTGRYRARAIKRRAETIARTESLRAVHAGNHDAFRQAIEAGNIRNNEIARTWVSATDERVRPDHTEANGQEVMGIEEPFIVGGEAMLHPGDINASPDQTINCRCAVTTRITTP